MTKPRFTPALQSYEANTAKGLCAYCGLKLDPDHKSISVDGLNHKIHTACWTAILVAERLGGNQSIRAAATSFVITSQDIFDQADVVRSYFKRKHTVIP